MGGECRHETGDPSHGVLSLLLLNLDPVQDHQGRDTERGRTQTDALLE